MRKVPRSTLFDQKRRAARKRKNDETQQHLFSKATDDCNVRHFFNIYFLLETCQYTF